MNEGTEMELQKVKTAQVMNLIQMAITKDVEIKKAIMADSDTVAKILQSNIIDELKQELKLQKLYYRYQYNDFTNENGNRQEGRKTQFLKRYASENTRNAYEYALNDFELFCYRHDLKTPVAATPSIIDKWILEQNQTKSPATVRRNVGAVSAFFKYSERESMGEIRNPVHGSKRPKLKRTKNDKFYSLGEVNAVHLQKIGADIQTILDNESNKELKAIISIMAFRGLRCGAFEEMKLHGESFRTVSKGEEVKGSLPSICLQYITDAEIKRNEPFVTWSSNRVKQNVKNHCRKLYDAGLISYRYSAHDFRHYFALTEYERDHDIYRLKQLLNHSSIAITENYLRGLNVNL